MNNFGMLNDLTKVRKVRSARISSFDQRGMNQDYWLIKPGSTITIADIDGPGCIRHIWMTSFCRRILGPGIIEANRGSYVAPVFEVHNALGMNWEISDPDYFRKVLIRMTWDNHKYPSVVVPLGDFFGIGNGAPGNYAALPLAVSVKPEEERKFGGQCSMNCYFPMPFNERAKIEIINENDLPVGLYFYIDYELQYEKNKEIAYFHAAWHRESPCNGWGPDIQVNSNAVQEVANLSGKDNYVVLDRKGQGHYVGCNLSVVHFQGSWWGEGDDMIYIDGEDFPSIHGTGSEDYFCHAWGMQKNYSLFNGSIIHESDMPGFQVSYRFHILDPIVFKESIKVTFEHGHANHLADDWSSTAYWYQNLVDQDIKILPVNQRLPIKPEIHREGEKPENKQTIMQKVMNQYKDYMDEKEKIYQEKYKLAFEFEKKNIQRAKEINSKFRGDL